MKLILTNLMKYIIIYSIRSVDVGQFSNFIALLSMYDCAMTTKILS